LLRDFADSGLLASDGLNDPFSLRSNGFHPAEAGVALTLDTPLGHRASLCRVTGYTANSDAYDALASPPSGHGLASLFAQELDRTTPVLLCTHTTGTRSCSVAEEAALASVFAERGLPTPALLPLKTLTGHALGASGLVDTALLAAAIARGHFPALEASLSTPAGMPLLKTPLPAGEGRVVWKCASAMGGHNALVTLSV
jgi:3-oxoacyl-[acyl-carrier-protein] synthase-1